MQAELTSVCRKLDGLVDAAVAARCAAGLQQRLDDLEARKAVLGAQLAAPTPPPVRLHPHLAERYRGKVAALRTAVEDPDRRAEALELKSSSAV